MMHDLVTETRPDAEDGGLPPQARELLDAVIAISTDLDLRRVLARIVESACQLTEARYGALGVIGSDGTLTEFVTVGVDDRTRELIGEPPHGRGILRLLIDHPVPLRLDEITGHPKASGFPPNHPPMTSFLGVPIMVRGAAFGNLYLTEKGADRPFTAQDEQLMEGLATAAGFVIENARAYGLSERRRQWLEATAELTDALHPPVAREFAMKRIARSAQSVSGAVEVAVLEVANDELRVACFSGSQRSQVDVLLRLRDDLLRIGAAESTPVLIEGLGGLLAVHVPLNAHLGDPVALLALFRRNGGGYDFEDREMLAAFADAAGLALDRAQAVVDRAELAVVSERDRIARDLHDVVIQRLFATGMQLESLRAAVDAHDVAARIDKAVDDLDLTVKDIRSTIFALENNGHGTLRREIHALVREYVPVLGFTPSVRTLGPVDTAVSSELHHDLLAVLREALSNVARHALAEHTEVQVQARGDEVVLKVVDDGIGLPSGRHESGLRNARRRAAALGGSLALEAHEPHGTAFAWRVPLA